MARPTPEQLALLRKKLAQRGIREEPVAGTIPRRDAGDPDDTGAGDPPLAGGQERLWFLDQFEPGSALYNDALALTIRVTESGAALDPERFRAAFQEVVRRHEILRTTFHTGAAGPVQRVEAQARLGEELPFRVLDLRAEPDAEARLEAALLEDVQRPFELDRLPLLRALLAQVDENRWVFGLAMHHIISDGVSYGVIYEELGTIYRALGAGRPSPLPELPIQFADFAAWERARVTEERVAAMLPFWRRYLGGDLPAQVWPAREATPRNRGAYHRFRFPDATYAALGAFCREQALTSNWVLMAAYLVMLHTFGGQEDLRIGTPTSTRKHGELEKLIGFFVQTTLLRVDLSGNPTFREVLERTRATALEVSRYEDTPFERVVQAVRPGRDQGEVPLIQAWIAPMKDLMPVMQLPGMETSYRIVDGHIARFELALILDEARGGVEAFFEYDTDLFEPQVVAAFEARYLGILRQGVDHPETRLALFRSTHPAPAGEARRKKRAGLKSIKGAVRRRREG